jgi:hypothetical protein
MEIEFTPRIFEKYSNIKCHENPFSGLASLPAPNFQPSAT